MAPTFVIKPAQLPALNFLAPDHPWPVQTEWINRGTNHKLQHASVDMLLRTLFRDVLSPSLVRLHRSAGLRAIFSTDKERDRFARALSAAQEFELNARRYLVTAVFDDVHHVTRAVSKLKDAGLPENSITVLWRAGRFLEHDFKWSKGHGMLSVVGAVAGGGIAGAMLGVAVLAIPGVIPAAAAGAAAASAFSSIATVGAAFGSTGGAIARMLTDHDIEGVSETCYAPEMSPGKMFIAVDMRVADLQRPIIRQMLRDSGGTAWEHR